MDTASPRSTRRSDAVLIAGLLAFPSLYLLEKYLGKLAILPYLAFVVALVALWRSRWPAIATQAMGERRARWVGLGTLVVVTILLLVVVHPLANSGAIGPGSDSDEALIQATTALLHGHFPYSQPTYLGNPITPMPGSLILAAPFVLLGLGRCWSLAWLVAGIFLLRRCWSFDTARTIVFCGIVLVACPAIPHMLAIGDDYPANSLMVLVFVVLLQSSSARANAHGAPIAWATLLGVSLSSRANFLFLLPLTASRLIQLRGPRIAWTLTAVTAAAAVAVTLPFWLHDPAHFSPLHTVNKLDSLEGVLPHARFLILTGAGGLALVLSRPRWNTNLADFLRNAAAVEAALVLARTVLWWLGGYEPRFGATTAGQFFLYFGLGWLALRARSVPHGRANARYSNIAPSTACRIEFGNTPLSFVSEPRQ